MSPDESSAGPFSIDRATLATGVALAVVALLAWVGLLSQAGLPGGATGEDMAMGGMAASSPLAQAAAFVAAWGLMMAAMMLPSATPMIALYRTVHRNSGATGQRGVPTALFALTYLLVWTAFGVPVYVAGVVLAAAAAANETARMLVPYGVALVLIAAGAYQLTPLKAACLRTCRSPLGFLMGSWRTGFGGTFRLGLSHAAYCVGCCWALMLVLVAAGAMGLTWVVLIAAAVFVEKLLPRGEWTARAIGLVLLAIGVLVALQPGLADTLRGPAMAM